MLCTAQFIVYALNVRIGTFIPLNGLFIHLRENRIQLPIHYTSQSVVTLHDL
jgi:hypothetical protein